MFGQWIELGWIQQKGGKIVHAWAFEGDLPEPFECKSNLFELEWPPRSGKYQKFPEVDQACFFSDKAARRKLKSRQVPFLDRLRAALQGAAARHQVAAIDPNRPDLDEEGIEAFAAANACQMCFGASTDPV